MLGPPVTVLEQHGISLFLNSFPAKIVLVRERMQTFANFALYVSVWRSNWPLFSQSDHFQKGLHCCH